MTGIDGVKLLLSLLAGIGLGATYFGALWWTVRELPKVRRPRSWLVGSFLLRMALALAVFYLLLRWGILAMGAAMGGFLLARMVWLGLSLRNSLREDLPDDSHENSQANHGHQP